jgi:hypothetical protein
MEKLEGIAKTFVEKHPIVSSIIAIKLIDVALISGAYALWPDETRDFANNVYRATQNNLPVFALWASSWQKELVTACRELPNMPYSSYTGLLGSFFR